MLAHNNLPLKIYCENIVISFLNFNLLFFIFFPLYFLLFFSSFFSLSFFLLHTCTLTLFLFFLLSSFSLPLPPHTCPYFSSFFLSLAFFATTSHSRTFHTVSAPLSSLKVSAFFFSFFVLFLTIRKLQGREKMLMKKKKVLMIET